MKLWDQTIGEFFVHKSVPGEIGIEIEQEYEGHLDRKEIKSYWKVDKDGSLRGESAEFILRKPVARKNVRVVLSYLNKQIKKQPVKLQDSWRTSVHIHLNTQGQTIRSIFTHICLYLLVEDLLVPFAGPTRVGNIFCLRARDAEGLISVLEQIALTGNIQLLENPEALRYASININALVKYNSLEFRALRGTIDPKNIMVWIKLLLAIKDRAAKYKNPRELLRDYSRLQLPIFVDDVLGKGAWGKLKWDGCEDAMRKTMRLVQDVAFASNWESN